MKKDRYLEPVGMKAGLYFRLTASDLIKLPAGSEIFTLPGRSAVYYDAANLKFIEDKGRCAVAAFLSPGYTVTYNSAYKEKNRPKTLPLFSYAACAFHEGEIYAAAVRVDKSLCHDPQFMDMKKVRKNTKVFGRLFPQNKLIKHLADCALCYGCPNAKNFFLNRYEAPLPTSPACNAQCAGCISYQPEKKCPVTQPRIKFIPRPEEIAEIALFHIKKVKEPVVSFGQGCEGEPLLSADIIEKAIRLIRRNTSKGVINMNTNGSSPRAIAKLFDAGLDGIRVSLNSAREKYYTKYYKPKGYDFGDVLRSMGIAGKKRAFVSVNYLTMPGFTDSKDEFSAFRKLIERARIDMIQWRNLNYDPIRYFKELNIWPDASGMLGVKEITGLLKKEFPELKMGYFNRYEYINSRRV